MIWIKTQLLPLLNLYFLESVVKCHHFYKKKNKCCLLKIHFIVMTANLISALCLFNTL